VPNRPNDYSNPRREEKLLKKKSMNLKGKKVSKTMVDKSFLIKV
jgi:hypothetical protein